MRRSGETDTAFDDDGPFVPDIITPEQYTAAREARESSGEKRLLFAVLETALRDIASWTPGAEETDHMGTRERLYWEARRWVMTRDDFVFGFDTICAAFGIDPAGIRRRIMAGDFRRARRAPAKTNGKVVTA